MRKISVLVSVIIFIALSLGAIGLFIPYWYTTETTGTLQVATMTTKTYTGLWHTCWRKVYSVENDYGCDTVLNTSQDTDGLKAVQAVTVIGLVIVCIAFVLSIVDLFCFEKKCWAKIVGAFAILAGVVLLISPIVYGTTVRDDYTFDVMDLSAGFALLILTSALAFLAGIIACLA